MIEKKRLTCTCFFALLLILAAVGCQTDNGPAVDAAWSEWIKANHHQIRSLDSGDTDYGDLQFLKPLLAGRRLVQLGENGHGVAEFSRAKVRLIKFLHEEMAFDVIAFESNIFECFQADMHAADWTAEEMMGRSIFPVWHTEDVLELYRYIKESKSTSRPLILAGFDEQQSSFGKSRRPALFQEVISRIDPDYAAEVGRQDLVFVNSYDIDKWPAEQVDQCRLFYDNLRQWLDEHLEELTRLYPQTPLLPLALRQAAWSERIFIDQRVSAEEGFAANLRDRAMADNVDALLERFYPDKKIMLWAHNMHIDHNSNLAGIYNYEKISMGYWLVQRHRPLLYTVGFFMYQGEAALNGQSVYTIDPAPSGTLEAILFQTGAEFAFVDLLNQQECSGNSWMFSTIHFRDWGTGLAKMMPRQEFDGMFYVKTVKAPPYIDYYEPPAR